MVVLWALVFFSVCPCSIILLFSVDGVISVFLTQTVHLLEELLLFPLKPLQRSYILDIHPVCRSFIYRNKAHPNNQQMWQRRAVIAARRRSLRIQNIWHVPKEAQWTSISVVRCSAVMICDKDRFHYRRHEYIIPYFDHGDLLEEHWSAPRVGRGCLPEFLSFSASDLTL